VTLGDSFQDKHLKSTIELFNMFGHACSKVVEYVTRKFKLEKYQSLSKLYPEIAYSGEIDSMARFVASMPVKKTPEEDRSRI
jgi:hypothetical protein